MGRALRGPQRRPPGRPRALAENAALARELAAWSRGRGKLTAAARIAEEAELEELYHEQVRRMLEGLEPSDPDPA